MERLPLLKPKHGKPDWALPCLKYFWNILGYEVKRKFKVFLSRQATLRIFRIEPRRREVGQENLIEEDPKRDKPIGKSYRFTAGAGRGAQKETKSHGKVTTLFESLYIYLSQGWGLTTRFEYCIIEQDLKELFIQKVVTNYE